MRAPPRRHSFRRAAATLLELFRGVRGGDPDLRAEFQRQDRSRGRNGARAFCQVTIVLLCASEAVSYLAKEAAVALLGIRSTAVVVLVAIHWLLGTHLGKRRSRELALLSVLVIAGTMEALAVRTGGPTSYQHDRLNLLVLGTAVLLTWPRWWSALAGAMVLATYLGGAFFVDALRAGSAAFAQAGYLVASGIVAVGITGIRERARWRDFLVRHALDRAQREKLEHEQRYRLLVETAGSALVVLAPDHRILEFNPEAERLFGRRRDEVLGQDYLRLFVPRHAWPVAAAFVRSVLGGGHTGPVEGRVRRSDGAKRIVLWKNRCLMGLEGQALGLVAVGQDITEFREAEEARRQSEARYRAVVEDQTELVCRCTPDGALTFVNDAFCRYFGKSRQEIIGHAWLPTMLGEDVRRARQLFAEIGPDRPTATIELRVRGQMGEFCWQQWTNRVILDAKGSVVEFQSVGRDITALKRAEEEVRILNLDLENRVVARTAELAESEARFRSIFESGPNAMVITDERGRFIASNPAFRRLLGLTDEQARVFTVTDLTHPDDVPATVTGVRGVYAGERDVVRLEKRYVRPDGRLVWAHTAVVATRMGPQGTRRLFAMIEDVTDRKREDALVMGERHAFERLAQSATLGEAMTALLEAMERPDPEMVSAVFVPDGIGRFEHLASPRLTEDCLRALAALAAAGGNGGTSPFWERGSLTTVDLETAPAWREARAVFARHGLRACWAHPIAVPGGGVGGVLMVYVRTARPPDAAEAHLIERTARVAGLVIERKQMDERVRQHQRELAHVGRLSLVGELSAGLAHELHQPLAAIVNYAGACERRLDADPENRDQTLYLVRRIREVALHGGETIKRVKRFARKDDPPRRLLDLNDLVRRAADLAEPETRRNGLTVRLDLDAGLPMVEVDGIQIEQVILNLVTNALEAMSANGNRAAHELTIRSCAETNGAVTLTVSDNGPGIDPRIRDSLFEPFSSTKTAGLGLGLSISRSIIEGHGGQIWARGNPAGGAIFGFTLPRGDA
jgi:PAS domain S-box-containing protein